MSEEEFFNRIVRIIGGNRIMSDKKYEDWLELMKDTPKEELLKHHYNLLFKVDKQKEVLDKIKEKSEENKEIHFDNGIIINGLAIYILELLEEIK